LGTIKRSATAYAPPTGVECRLLRCEAAARQATTWAARAGRSS